MMTVNEVSKLSGVSIRTLQYYDNIGLLIPSSYSDAGYRLYDEENLNTLQQILLFRELEIPLKEIKEILDNPNVDKNELIEDQIKLLTMKKEHIEKIISFARDIKKKGESSMGFKAFDKTEMEAFEKEAKEKWGNTDAYKEYEERKSSNDFDAVLLPVFEKFGKIKDDDPSSDEAKETVKLLQDTITKNYYTCENHILQNLGLMYVADERFKNNIDSVGGEGTAEFASKAIENYCK